MIAASAGVACYCCAVVIVVQLIIATGNVQGAFGGAAASSVHRFIVFFG